MGVNRYQTGFRAVLQLSLLLAAAAMPAAAQIGTGTISGIISDQTGAVIVSADVTAVSAETGFRRTTVADERGQYNFPGLRPGAYTLSVESAGFRRVERQNLTLQVDQNLRLNFAMELGQVTEIV